MKIGVSTLFGVNNRTILQSVKELESKGVTTIELMYEYKNLVNLKQARIIKKKKNLSFTMHCPSTGVVFSHPNPNFSGPQIKMVEDSLKIAKTIGCTHYVMHGGFIPPGFSHVEKPFSRNDHINLFIKRFKPIFTKYSNSNLKIVIENMPYKTAIGGEIEDIKKIKKAIPSLGICLDISHAIISKKINYYLDNSRIDEVHISDNNLKQDQHLAIGKGKVNFKRIIKKLDKRGYKGNLIIENLSFKDSITSFNNLKKLV